MYQKNSLAVKPLHGITPPMATQGSEVRDAIPLYHQIFLTLRDEILSGIRRVGAAVPTEHELSATYGVSRTTARRALDELARLGLVERRRRIGTRVSFKAPDAPIEADVDQAIESLLAFGRGTRVRVVELATVPADPETAGRLDIEPNAPVLRALRIRSTKDAPLGVITSFVPAAFGALLTKEALTERPLLELLRAGGHEIGGGRQMVISTAADHQVAALLETEVRAPILRIDRILRNSSGRPLAFTSAQYRGDRYRLSLDLQGSSPAVDLP